MSSVLIGYMKNKPTTTFENLDIEQLSLDQNIGLQCISYPTCQSLTNATLDPE